MENRTVASQAVVAGLHLVHRRIAEEVCELTIHRPHAAHLPEQPVEALLAQVGVLGDELVVLLGEVLQDRAGFEQIQRLAWVLRRIECVSNEFLSVSKEQ